MEGLKNHTHFASATASISTHCVVGPFAGVFAASFFFAFFFCGPGLVLVAGGTPVPLRTPRSGSGTSGGGPPPPWSTTHWVRYVFRICENTCSTSPAGTTFTMRRALRLAPPSPRSSLSPEGLERWRGAPFGSPTGFEERARPRGGATGGGGGGDTRSADRTVCAIAACAPGFVVTGTFAAVGNSCRPARRPVKDEFFH